MQLPRLAPFALAVAASVVFLEPSADASERRVFEDRQRGFRIMIGDKFEQVPPKLTTDESYIVGHWYADAAKFARKSAPEFQVYWFATPKFPTGGVVTPKGDEKLPAKPAEPATPEEIEKKKREDERPKSVDDAFDKLFTQFGRAFGGDVPAAKEIWKTAAKSPTKTPKVNVLWAEVNDPDDKKAKKTSAAERAQQAYAFIAKLVLDRPGETIEVGFLGLCPLELVKDGKKHFIDIPKSFEDLAKIATDSRNSGAQTELDVNDPEAFRAAMKKSYMIPGWTCYDTPHYMVVYPVGKKGEDGVDPGLAKAIGDQIESLRTEVYEVMFPADRKSNAISVIRCCKDQSQYFAYGGPMGSAGYWYAPGKELVFYEMDRGKRGDSLRVLYHEGFHQYIYYSVGELDPHQWFNEGNGDYFFGFSYVNGKWVRGANTWRRDLAKQVKRDHKFPQLWDWLHWSHAEYYGRNASNVPIGNNYALGWDFVYFLRTTKKKEYQGILDRYFASLKGSVTKARDARDALDKARDEAKRKRREKDGEPPAASTPPAADGKDPGTEPKPPAEPPAVPPGPDAPVPPGPPDTPIPPGPPDTPVVPPGPPDTPLPPGPPDTPVPPGSDTPPVPPVTPPDSPDPPPATPPETPPAPPATPPETPPAPPEAPPQPQPPATDPSKPTPPSDPTKPGEPPIVPPPEPKPTDEDLIKKDPDTFDPKRWLERALEDAFRGVDIRQLEKDWLDS